MGSMPLTKKSRAEIISGPVYDAPSERHIELLTTQCNYSLEAAQKLSKSQAQLVIGAHFDRTRKAAKAANSSSTRRR